ncbi:hypothetical protein FA15DRAFT_760707 [Coprinopsis marcescibilis]|uniref:separase n=1 Tax=Coprinopsis marcescibilis TaxID=230819 RepID=A0A5C3KEL1_COPMA|nr:hypothetical protein FA15DRAFT_760707 [Coprinopsis marcescibilis]
MATRQRRKPEASTIANGMSPDQLADALASKLTLKSKPTSSRTAVDATKVPKVDKVSAMRALNAAMQSLSDLMRAGWKKSTTDTSTAWRSKNAEANSIVSRCSEQLSVLRRLDSGNIDVERAALAIVGKLLSLDMHDAARGALKQIQPAISTAFNLISAKELVSLSIPKENITSTTNLTMISTFLAHALTATAYTSSEPAQLEALSKALDSPTDTPSLLSWMPLLSHLDTKLLDLLLTRSYTALNKSTTSPSSTSPKPTTARAKSQQASPKCLFSLRMYALRCLGSTSPGIMEANPFWEQPVRMANSFARSCSSSDEERDATGIVLSQFNELVSVAEKRSDAVDFLDGEKFVSFCELWIGFAKKYGDICILDRIGTLMGKIPSTSTLPTPAKADSSPSYPTVKEMCVEGAKICAAFTRNVVLLEQPDSKSEFKRCIESNLEIMRKSPSLSHLVLGELSYAEEDEKALEEFNRMSSQVDRCFERLRRATLQLIESPKPETEDLKPSATEFLQSCISILRYLITPKVTNRDVIVDILSRTFNTMFTLAKATMDVSNPQTYIPAYDYLADALKICDSVQNPAIQNDTPNYIRCISGGFYNIACRLFQESRFGAAVPFLKEACSLGERALEGRKQVQASPISDKGKGKEKEKDTARAADWAQLEQLLYKRWEMIAVCYLRNGDRTNAHDAFMKCIRVYLLSTTSIAKQTDNQCPSQMFSVTDKEGPVKQLVGLLDRVTYVGACELLLPPEDVSLRTASSSSSSPHLKLDLRVLGIVLEYQFETLLPSRGKEGASRVLVSLLKDALDLYNTSDDISGYLMPIRRVRVLLRCLEFLYRDGNDSSEALSHLGYESVDKIGQEVLALLNRKDLAHDVGLSVYQRQYQISVHLWIALHAHRQGHPQQLELVTDHVNAAAGMLKDLQIDAQRSPRASSIRKASSVAAPVSASPKVVRRTATKKMVSPRPTRTTRSRAPPPAPRKPPPAPRKAPAASSRIKAPVAPSSRARAPVTPNIGAKAALPLVSEPAQPRTPPRPSIDPKAGLNAMPFDDFGRFHDLLMLTARILGILSLVLPRVQLLAGLRRLSQRQLGASSEAFFLCSLELAYEYVQLGKLKRATSIFGLALDVVRAGETSPEISSFYLLRFAEAFALNNDVAKSAKVYLEAFEHINRILPDHKNMSSVERIQTRTRKLELSAMAANVFGLIQLEREDSTAYLDAMLQSFRLWNRAIDAIARLSKPAPKVSQSSNPFEPETTPESSGTPTDRQTQSKYKIVRKSGGEFEWRIFEGLLSAFFSLADAYSMRGSPKEADHLLKQALGMANNLNLPIVASRALSRLGEVQMRLGRLEQAQESLDGAAMRLGVSAALETINHKRLLAWLNERSEMPQDAQQVLFDSMKLLEELNVDFHHIDSQFSGLRRSLDNREGIIDVVAPELLALVLCRCIWLLRENIDDDFHALVDKLEALPMSTRTKVEENALMANLTLHNVHTRFRSDMLLSSLTESTIAIPMGMSSHSGINIALPIQDVMNALDAAEKHFKEGIRLTIKSGDVLRAREAAVSWTLVKAFQTSLGKLGDQNAVFASSLLDASSAITLRREMLDAIQQKLLSLRTDDAEWSMINLEGAPKPTKPKPSRPPFNDSDVEMDDDEEDEDDGISTKKYWESVHKRYQSQSLASLSTSQTQNLPSNWTIIHVNITEDKSTLIISREECGDVKAEPLVFCVPLKGRRDNGVEDEEHLTYGDAMNEFAEIIRLSNEGTKDAVNVRSGEDRSNWWNNRIALDTRLRDLLENIEFCWLGAFKTILSPKPNLTPDLLAELRTGIDRVFQRSLHINDKKPNKPRTTGHRRGFSQSMAPSQVSLDDTILRCFSTLSPKCKDEELEDLLYFVLDLYQLHGVPIAIAEVDATQVVIDLRAVLEEHNVRLTKHRRVKNVLDSTDEHLFLVLDRNIQNLPWECLPIMKGRSISRIPSIDFLLDRIQLGDMKRHKLGDAGRSYPGSAVVNPRSGYFILNPSGDLRGTEGRFKEWAEDMRGLGWDGIMGKAVSEQQFVDALRTRDFVVYCGHGGGEQYIKSSKIRSLPSCAVTMLWGCSSGVLKDMGDYDRTGTPYNYMLAGCPTLIANLWDVTDKDIDTFSLAVFDKIGLKASDISQPDTRRNATSVVAAVAQSRNACKLKYLTGAAPVVYGIPFYL